MGDDDVIMYSSDKEILQGKRDPSEFENFPNRLSQIGSRVRTRTPVLIEEIHLLRNSELSGKADEFLTAISENFKEVHHGDLSKRLEDLSRDLEEVEQKCSEVPEIREKIRELQDRLESFE